jgi:septal ring factor EnvC (AmiA/AmiB activator)
MNLASREQVSQLTDKIEKLTRKVQNLEKNLAKKAKEAEADRKKAETFKKEAEHLAAEDRPKVIPLPKDDLKQVDLPETEGTETSAGF